MPSEHTTAFTDSINTSHITIGADPEVFLADTVQNKFVTAIGKIGGSKEYPRSITDHIAVQEDNVLLEFTIPPAKCKSDFLDFINEGLSVCTSLAHEHRLEIAIHSAVHMPKDEIELYEQSMEFGCEPDFNIYTLSVNPKPSPEELYNDETKTHLRTAGGHIHVGYMENNRNFGYKVENIPLVQAMDICLGLWSITIDTNPDRRRVYGGAGSFRMKPYGVEYRTLSNFWLKTPELSSEVYTRTLCAYRMAVIASTTNSYAKKLRIAAEACANIINRNDKQQVGHMLCWIRDHLHVSVI